jgi:hypothetical protein
MKETVKLAQNLRLSSGNRRGQVSAGEERPMRARASAREEKG